MEIEIPEVVAELLVIQSAMQEIPVEELVERAIQNYMERDESIADG